MSDITLILLGAGSSSRFLSPVKKQWLYSGAYPLWLKVAKDFESIGTFAKIIIVSTADEIQVMKHFADYTFTVGGSTRQESLNNALAHVQSPYVLVSDIARCCIDKAMVERIVAAKRLNACVVPVLKAVDTMYLGNTPIDRENVKIIQTPQLSATGTLKTALQTEQTFTDDSSAVASAGGEVVFVEGSQNAHKLTTLDDLAKLPCLEAPLTQTFTGFGIDTHAFEANKPMKLCGVKIDTDFGFKAHSDGDVAIHAVIDALLGAAGMGDIGELYPDTDASFAGIDSALLLQDTVKKITAYGFTIGNIDMTVVAQTPRLAAYKAQMKASLASLLGIEKHLVNIKATTSEKLGFIGRKEGVTVHAVANVYYYQWQRLSH